MSTQPPINSIIEAFEAKQVFAGSVILDRVASLTADLRIQTAKDTYVTPDEFYFTLANDVSKLRRLQLESEVGSEGAEAYITQLINSLSELQDETEEVELRAVSFLARLNDMKADFDNEGAEFEGWYMLAAQEILNLRGLKLDKAALKAIGKAEYSRLTNRANVNVSSLIEATKIILKQISTKQKSAREKFAHGQRQADAAWTKNLPTSRGYSPTKAPDSMLSVSLEEEEDEVTFVSHKSKMTEEAEVEASEEHSEEDNSACIPEAEASVFIAMEDEMDETVEEVEPEIEEVDIPVTPTHEIKGTFVKHGTPQPVTIIETVSDATPDPEEETTPIADTPQEDAITAEEHAQPTPVVAAKTFAFEDDEDEAPIFTPVKETSNVKDFQASRKPTVAKEAVKSATPELKPVEGVLAKDGSVSVTTREAKPEPAKPAAAVKTFDFDYDDE